jgi:hypothetical protein
VCLDLQYQTLVQALLLLLVLLLLPQIKCTSLHLETSRLGCGSIRLPWSSQLQHQSNGIHPQATHPSPEGQGCQCGVPACAATIYAQALRVHQPLGSTQNSTAKAQEVDNRRPGADAIQDIRSPSCMAQAAR